HVRPLGGILAVALLGVLCLGGCGLGRGGSGRSLRRHALREASRVVLGATTLLVLVARAARARVVPADLHRRRVCRIWAPTAEKKRSSALWTPATAAAEL